MSEILFPIVALVGAFLGAVSDFKTREVPNWINYFLISFGLGGFLIVSIIKWSILPIAYSLAGMLIFYAVAAGMFYLGQWGGGDAKMLIGLGALLPTYPIVLLNFFSPQLSFWPWMVTLFLNTILIGGVFGLLVILFILLKNFSTFQKEFKYQFQEKIRWAQAVLMVLIIPVVTYFINGYLFLASLFAWLSLWVLLFAYLVALSVERSCMIRVRKPTELTIGDWLAKDVRIRGELVCKASKIGLREEEIAKLVKLQKQGKLKEVRIREGLPFTYAFFLGLLFSFIFGDLIFILVGSFF